MALPHWYLPGDSAEREGERGPTSDPTTPPPPIPSSLLLLSPTPTEPPLLGHAHAHPRLPRPGASHGGRPHRAGGARGHPAAKRKKWTGEGVCARVVRTQANTPLTNRTGTGLRSAPRSNKATRLLTRPGRTTKSYAKDSSPRAVKLQSASWDPRRASAGAPSPACSGAWPKPIRIRLRTCGKRSPRSGMDSDLEAFSHNPADGSFAALPGQTAAKTNYLNPRFLSY